MLDSVVIAHENHLFFEKTKEIGNMVWIRGVNHNPYILTHPLISELGYPMHFKRI